jgi:hypothetical protein
MNAKDMRYNESIPEGGSLEQNRRYKGREKGGYRQWTLYSRGEETLRKIVKWILVGVTGAASS